MPTLSLGKYNPRLTEIGRAVREGTLTPDGLLPIEGSNMVMEAISSGLEMPELYTLKDTVEFVPPGCRDYRLEPAAFKKIQSSETSQGIVALVRLPVFTLDAIVTNPRGPIVVLDALQDPGNVGTILRSTEAFEAAGCIALPRTVSAYNPKTVRASAGSVLRLPHVWNVEFGVLIKMLREAGIRVVATSPRPNGPSVRVTDWDWQSPTAVIVGNEGRGVASEIAAQCDAGLLIEHDRRVESLNSGIAASVVLYEAYRQRGVSAVRSGAPK